MFRVAGVLLILVWFSIDIFPQEKAPQVFGKSFSVFEDESGLVVATRGLETRVFTSWKQYFSSGMVPRNLTRCGETSLGYPPGGRGSTSDCTNGITNPVCEYDPQHGPHYRIPIVVHVIEHTNGNGFIPDAMIFSQIDVLNEDFLALAGTPGGPGTNAKIEFFLATEDPNGQPTNGVMRYVNNDWYNDNGNYQQQIHWDTNRYLNIYTNTASGYLGYAYVPNGGGVVGEYFDGVVNHWEAFGRNSPYGPPYDQGRTATHEIGHYLGLWHTFDGGCSGGNCYTNGDLICDTEAESNANFGCNAGSQSCGSRDPVENYMNYSDDLCMSEFTPEQNNRMRCTIENWRPDLYEIYVPPPPSGPRRATPRKAMVVNPGCP